MLRLVSSPRAAVLSATGGLCLMLAATAPATAEDINADTARLGWLDKTTARVGESSIAVGGDLRLGSLTITVRSCVRRVPPDDPESAAFLDIVERAEGVAAKQIFEGWMFASSPSLSAMDHAVYDVWVLRCEIPADRDAGDGGKPDSAPEAAPVPVDPGGAPLD